jgi:plastocyanin
MRHLRVTVVAVLAVALVVLSATAALAATKSVGVTKSGTKYKFNPATLHIKKGDTVKWSWSGSIPHNVKGSGFTSKTGTKVTFSRKFTKAGTYKVVCTIHQALGQRMTVVVK